MPLLDLVVLEIMTVPSHQTTLHLIHFHRVIYVRDLACPLNILIFLLQTLTYRHILAVI